MWIELLLQGTAILFLIPVLVIFVQVLCAYLPQPKEVVRQLRPARIAVLVPAHNEETGIAATINSILRQLQAGDRLLVVADNCSDNTARIASEHGAEVIERHHLENRGKGYALDFGIQFLAKNPPDVVVIIDADCELHDDALVKLTALSSQHNRPVQCLYLMLSPPDTGLKIKIAEFAWLVRNHVRPLGNTRLGLPCQLMGTGMAFPWATISGSQLANSNLVEDMQLGVDLALTGNPPLFYEDALVTSYFPATAKAQSTQRTRWEHGHLGIIFSQVPRLLAQGLIKRNKDMLAMALDLCVPPLALLVMLLSILFIVSAVACAMEVTCLPLFTSLVSIFLLALSITLAWWRWARHIISPIAFLSIPLYVLSKLPYYFKFLLKREKQWISTDRKNKD